jgi:hypothetical protein
MIVSARWGRADSLVRPAAGSAAIDKLTQQAIIWTLVFIIWLLVLRITQACFLAAK